MITVGTKVKYKANFGEGPTRTGVVEYLELCPANSKYGDALGQISLEDAQTFGRRVIVDMGDKWAYGYQLVGVAS